MKNKHLDYIIAFRELHGHYPPYIHRHLSHRHLQGGNVWDDIKHGFIDFGNGFKSVFDTIGNFINDHASIFAQVAVTGSLMLLFPEFAPELALASSQELLGKVLNTAPTGAPKPSQADIDKALADYKKDPRYAAMIAPMKLFIKNIIQFLMTDGNIPYSIDGHNYSTINITGANVWPDGDEDGNITLNLKYDNGNQVASPIEISVANAQNYQLLILCPATGVKLNADGSNWKSLINPLNTPKPLTADQQKVAQQEGDINKKIYQQQQATQNATDMDNQFNLDLYRTQFPSFPSNYNDLDATQKDDLNYFRGWKDPNAVPTTPEGITSIVVDNTINSVMNNTDGFFDKLKTNPVAATKAFYILNAWLPVNTTIANVGRGGNGLQYQAAGKVMPFIDMTLYNKYNSSYYTQAQIEDMFDVKAGSGRKRKYKRKLKK
jgi:hypothetical protein